MSIRKLTQGLAKFHEDKVTQLEAEFRRRKSSGEKKIKEMQDELTHDLGRILHQINDHKTKAKEIATAGLPKTE